MTETDEPQIEVHRVLPQSGAGTLTADESNAILEVAYLATTADDDLADEELTAFRDLAEGLRALVALPPSAAALPGERDDELNALLERFAANIEHADPQERLIVLAKILARPIAKETAYKVAFAMALCDLAENDDEEDFDDELVEALGLSDERADELASQVYEAIGGDDDDDERDDQDGGGAEA
jgi:hypothetical protein